MADYTCNSVEEHEVLKVGDLSPLPALRHVGRLEELTRGGQGNPPGMGQHTHVEIALFLLKRTNCHSNTEQWWTS